ncbi:MAG: DUF3536 domain-containing protein [Chloroflexota bacterium]
MERYICIHGHFYQPPRENAWLEYVETQDSAYPYHDWNERVTAECYAPNSASRILDAQGRITEIANNYAKISFDFGPTLLRWLETNSPETYRAVIESDKETERAFSGHGSAMAQAYNHIIMPLGNRRDKETQVVWGIRDFEHRFGRKPEGMWLPETAVDLETLDLMAEQGIRFTILSPHQASRVRRLGAGNWRNVANAAIDPSMAYELNLPQGRKLAIFFYDGPISHSVAFEDILKNGDKFSSRLTGAFSDKRPWAQLVHVATDGETYGHHHRFGDMALAFALRRIEKEGLVRITNYGQYLAEHPPTHEVTIIENTSWSCSHGIERWRSDCGCNAGRNPAWHQAWRAPLREAMDWLRDTLAPKYEEMASRFLLEPWAARDDYVSVILDRSPDNIQKFLRKHRRRDLNETEAITVLKLLELQRHAMLMYTSCGWFFDELSGIETVQVIQYACRAVQLAGELFGDDIEARFLERLEMARSHIPEHAHGRRIYEELVRPAMVDLTGVTAHFAVSSLFEEYGKQAEIYCYHVDLEDYRTTECGKGRLAVGQARVTSNITGESATLSFGALHLGDHNVSAGVCNSLVEEAFQTMVNETTHPCAAADFPGVIRLLDKHFGISTYSIRDLFQDEQRKVLNSILGKAISEIGAAYYRVYEHYYPPIRFLSELHNPVPKSFQQAAEFILNSGLRKAFREEPLERERISRLLEEIRAWRAELDTEGLSYLMQQSLEKMMARLVAAPEDTALLKELAAAAEMLPSLPFPVDLWKVQNLYGKILKVNYPEFQKKAKGDKAAGEWLARFVSLGERLSMSPG